MTKTATPTQGQSVDTRLEAARAAMADGTPPPETGRLLLATGLGQNELARRLGKTAGVVHHYIDCATGLAPALRPLVVKARPGRPLPAGRLSFKTARVLASVEGWDRQAELASPFLTRQMPGVEAELFVVFAKRHGEMKLDALIAKYETRFKEVDQTTTPAPVLHPQPSRVELNGLHGDLLRLAGLVADPDLQTQPAVALLPLRSAYRLLRQRGDWLL